MKKSGITLVSIIIYVILFFAFSTIAISISTNINMKTLSEKGKIYCSEQIQKLQANLLDSAKNSKDYDIIGNSIVFSNNDEYEFDEERKVVLKNGGVLVSDVESFENINIDELSGKKEDFANNLDYQTEYICLRVRFVKYSQTSSYELFFSLGDDNIE